MIDALLVNSRARTVKPVKINEDRFLEESYRLIGCRTVTVVELGAGETLWLDDEGLLSAGNLSFEYDGQRFFGNGIITGSNRAGEPVSTMKTDSYHTNLVNFENGHVTTDNVRFVPVPNLILPELMATICNGAFKPLDFTYRDEEGAAVYSSNAIIARTLAYYNLIIDEGMRVFAHLHNTRVRFEFIEGGWRIV